MINPYPLTFRPILKEKVWGGRRLARYGKDLPKDPAALVGESWELADLAWTSPSGGGGDPAHSVIANGPLAGQTISDALTLWRDQLLGGDIFQREQRTQNAEVPAFPLLVKYLDASQHLSVQVHPSPDYAAAHPDAHLKTESWYILDAEPVGNDAPVIFKGLREGVNESELRERIANGTLSEILLAEPAVPGHCHTLPSGTVHALGAGVLVAEIQTPSDTTFRLYDWTSEYDRPNRPLHIDQAIACIDFASPPPSEPRFRPAPKKKNETAVAKAAATPIRLAETEFYTIDECDPAAPLPLTPDHCTIIMAVAGKGDIQWNPPADALDQQPGEPSTQMSLLPIAAGSTVLVSAAVAADVSIVGDDHLRLLLIRLV